MFKTANCWGTDALFIVVATVADAVVASAFFQVPVLCTKHVMPNRSSEKGTDGNVTN